MSEIEHEGRSRLDVPSEGQVRKQPVWISMHPESNLKTFLVLIGAVTNPVKRGPESLVRMKIEFCDVRLVVAYQVP